MTPRSPNANSTNDLWLSRALLAVAVIFSTAAMSANEADADLWGHVQYGRNVLSQGLPATASYSYTAEGYRWINHENLAELCLAMTVNLCGPIGLLISKYLLGLFVIGAIVWSGRSRGVSHLALSVVVLLVSINLSYHWTTRPHLLSYLFLTLMLLLLGWCFHGWEGRWWLGRLSDKVTMQDYFSGQARTREDLQPDYCPLRMRHLWLVPIILLLWANSHGGFVAGFGIFAAYLACRSLEAYAITGRAAVPVIKRYAMMVAAAGLATLINPYGPGLHRWLFESLSIPRPEITEWHPPELFTPLFTPFWLLVAMCVLALIFSRKSRDFTHMILLLVVLWQCIEHRRHIPFFAVFFGFWAATHVDSVLERFSLNGIIQSLAGRTPRAGRLVASGLLIGLCFSAAFKTYTRLIDLPVRREMYPVSAFEFMSSHKLQGRLIVTYNWAQYAIAAFGDHPTAEEDPSRPSMTVAFDGRFRTCYPKHVIDTHFDLIEGRDGFAGRYRDPDSPPFDPAFVLRYKNPDLVLLNRYQPHSVQIMRRQVDWVLLYQDKVAQLWGKARRYDNPRHPDYFQPSKRSITDTPQTGSVSWPALPNSASNNA